MDPPAGVELTRSGVKEMFLFADEYTIKRPEKLDLGWIRFREAGHSFRIAKLGRVPPRWSYETSDPRSAFETR